MSLTGAAAIRRVRSSKVSLVGGLGTAVGVSLAQITIPVVLGSIVDHALLDENIRSLALLCTALVVLAVASSLCQIAHDLNFARRGETALLHLQKAGLSTILRTPALETEDQRSGRLHSLLVQDAPRVASIDGRLLGQSLLAATQLVGVLILLLLRHGADGLTAILLIPIYLLTPQLMTRRIRQASKDLAEARANVSTVLQESIQGAGDLRTFGRESWATDRLDRFLQQRRRKRAVLVLWSSAEWINYTFSFLVGAAVYWFGGREVLQGRMSIGELVTLVAILGYLGGPVARATRLWGEFQTSRVSRDRLNRLLETQVLAFTPTGTEILAPGAVPVKFDLVTFRYAPWLPPAADRLSFSVEAGAMVAVLGPSGAGKSTLAKLLLRIYHADEGSIEIAGRAIEEYEEETFRSSLGLIPQDPFLFPGTVAENIHLGREQGGRERLEQAARLANAHDFISDLPLGYETVIGDRGVGLSGGQRQRVALARAVFGNPGLLVLDEATSALDAESERAVQKGLYAARRDRTTFVISHRRSTIRECDHVLVLQQGRLAAFGARGDASWERLAGPASMGLVG